MHNISLLDSREAARLLGVSPGTLANWRSRGKGPAFIKLGHLAKYWPRDLEVYIQSRRQIPADGRTEK